MRRARVGVLFSGRGSNLGALIGAAGAADYPAEIVVAVSNRADAGGLEIARGAGVEAVCVPSKEFGKDREGHERAIDEVLRGRGVEVVCLAGYMRLLSPYLVGKWAGRMLNIHPSLLPAYKGLDTHARVLAAGAVRHGCSVHLVTEAMDEGPILGRAEVAVEAGDTEELLAARVLVEEHRLYPAVLAAFVRGHLPDGGAGR